MACHGDECLGVTEITATSAKLSHYSMDAGDASPYAYTVYASDGTTVVATGTTSTAATDWSHSYDVVTGLTPSTTYVAKLDRYPNTAETFTTLTDSPKIATESQWGDLADRIKAKADSSSIPTVVQTTGTSQTDAMSQDAVTNLIFSDDTYYKQVAIGVGAKTGASSSGNACSTAVGYGASAGISGTTSDSGAEATAIGAGSLARGIGTAIGKSAKVHKNGLAQGNGGVSVGTNATSYNTSIAIGGGTGSGISAGAYSQGDGSIAIGVGAKTNSNSGQKGMIALGAGASTGTTGVMSINTSDTSYGYKNSNYRLLTGLYDPQSAHDAATKGYVDSIAPVITMTTTDPGEGATLAANNFIAVYSAS